MISQRNRVLLWCARHCCLCGKQCDVNIEVAHLPGEEESSDISNAIPLCFDCHGRVGQYNPKHPKGTKYKKEELKARRDQIYDQYTSNRVPPILPQILLHPDGLPTVGFRITNHSNYLSAKAKIIATVFLGGRQLGVVDDKHGYYCGITPWHLNPRTRVDGNFSIPIECKRSNETLRIQLDVTVIDVYERHHEQLSQCFTYVRESKDSDGNATPPFWFLEPTSFHNLRKRSEERGHKL